MTVVLDGEQLTLDELVRIARGGERVEVAPAAFERVQAARDVVERAIGVTDGAGVYGVTTGVGVRKRVRVGADEMDAYNRRLIADHRMAAGPDAPREVVRAAMARLANGFAKGTSGVRMELLGRVVDALNAGETPRVRLLGSAGQSDLGPLADLAHGICGDMPLAAKEGISLINNNSFGTGLAALALADALRLLDALTVASALDWEAFAANTSPLHPAVADVRPYPGLRARSARMRDLLSGSYLWNAGSARNLQDPLTFRNAAAILGAADDGLGFAHGQLAIELNAAHENPLVVVGEELIISVPNYEALPLAAALDVARIALVPAISSAMERSIKLLQAPLTGLGTGLQEAEAESNECALSEFAWASQALMVEARSLAHPLSTETASTMLAEGIEDRITMAPLSARRLAEQVAVADEMLAIGLISAAQAIDVRGCEPLGAGTAVAYGQIRERYAFVAAGASIGPDRDQVVELVRSGELGVGG
ncbi:MAG TPA: aromatic amino acid ammonia-lyase [Gaiellales bacterium]|jgi:histidine ammonia-lyase